MLQRRQPLARTTGLRRTRLRKKPRRNAKPSVLRTYAESHESCANCGATSFQFGTVLHNHHLIKRGRTDDARNLLRLCRECHDLAEGHAIPDERGGYKPKLSLANCLYLKRQTGDVYDREFLTTLLRGKSASERRLPRAVKPKG